MPILILYQKFSLQNSSYRSCDKLKKVSDKKLWLKNVSFNTLFVQKSVQVEFKSRPPDLHLNNFYLFCININVSIFKLHKLNRHSTCAAQLSFAQKIITFDLLKFKFFFIIMTTKLCKLTNGAPLNRSNFS